MTTTQKNTIKKPEHKIMLYKSVFGTFINRKSISNFIKTIMSSALITLIIFIAGIKYGIKIEKKDTSDIIYQYKSLYVDGKQYFCNVDKSQGN